MSLQTIEIKSAKIAFDKEKTREHLTAFNKPCDCQYCRNYYKNLKDNFELIGFLANFGVDYSRAEEICPVDLGNTKESLINYRIYYCVAGSVSKRFSIKKEGFSVSFDVSSNIDVGHEITNEFFFLVINIDLPYILDEGRELPPPSFFGKCANKIASIVKKMLGF